MSNEEPRAIEQHALRALADLGLDLEALRDKSVLDIGAGSAFVARCARERGIKVISIDKHPDPWQEGGAAFSAIRYVGGLVEALPFPDGSFDLVISRSGPLHIARRKAIVAQALKEVDRILKGGGEFRFGPGPLKYHLHVLEQLPAPKGELPLTTRGRIERDCERAIDFLKTVNPNISCEALEAYDEVPVVTCYVMRKPLPELGTELTRALGNEVSHATPGRDTIRPWGQGILR